MKRKPSEKLLLKRKFYKFLYDNDVLEEYKRNRKDNPIFKGNLFSKHACNWLTHAFPYSNDRSVDWASLSLKWYKEIGEW